MSESLVDRIRAALDETERVARAAHYDGQRWYAQDELVERWPADEVVTTADRKVEATHIARHDPASVLRQVAAIRKLLELHEPFIADEDEPDPICQTCTEGSHLYDVSAYPCPTVLAIADACGIEVA